jgi:hypothetical protein
MVDLAGSERISKSGAISGGRLFGEARSVNMSLTALGRVVSGLVAHQGKKHVAYRDDPLTHLLKSSIGGNSRTALICCVTAAADSTDESLHTLRFAVQASHVKNRVVKMDEKKSEASTSAQIASSGHAIVFDSETLSGILCLKRR